MRWRRQLEFDRPPRPKVRRLTEDERDEVLAVMSREIDRSPVLKAFDVQVRVLRGRFYLDWRWGPTEVETKEPGSMLGRITPLEESNDFLLEVEYRQNRWSEVATGSPRKLIKSVAGDKRGTFHGLGALDKSLRQAAKLGVSRLTVKKVGEGKFAYTDTKEACSVQEALYHYFEVPIHVVAQPADWYVRRRTPYIVEGTPDRSRVLVRFLSSSWSGEVFGGTCLYLKQDDEWNAFTIRPNQSDDIRTAEAWLVKRKWKPW